MMKRPWARATAWLAFLGPFFFASYGFANWLAGRRGDVGFVAYPWERAIPFLPWTIVPYWSIDVLYGGSLFVCTTRAELDRHGRRLLAVQLVSVLCFIAFPLRFSFERPATSGAFGALFTALAGFDRPFNQAPSLHVALLVVIWVCLARRSRRPYRWLLHAWMTLIGVSVLTTYQHHFIDLPTGLAVGFLALWAIPDEGASPLQHLAVTRDPARRRLAVLYAVAAIACATAAVPGGAWLWLLWPAASLGLVGCAYGFIGARAFQKGGDGRLSAGARGLLAPYLVGARLNSRIWTRRHPEPAPVLDGVSIGRIPTTSDLAAAPFSAVIDLCAELSCGTRRGLRYRGIPLLDLVAPDESSLRDAALAIEDARRHGTVLVCCALGYSRSAAAVMAWMLMTRRRSTVDAALQAVRRVRPAVVLKGAHHRALEAFS